MTHDLRNPKDIKYTGHNVHQPKKWISLRTKKAKKLSIKKTMGPVKLNPEYTEWKEKQREKISKIKKMQLHKKHLKKKNYE